MTAGTSTLLVGGMLAIYCRSENPSSTDYLALIPPALDRTTRAQCARRARLACTAAIRRAGYAPWLLALGVVAMAALQEPTLLRTYGITLPWQSAWVVGATLLSILAVGVPPTRSIASQIVTSQVLVLMVGCAFGASLTVCDLLLGRADTAARAVGWGLAFVCSLYPFAIVLVAGRAAAAPSAALAAAIAALLAVVLAARFDSGNWSAPVLAATLLAGLAATAAARVLAHGHHAHRHPR